MFVLALDYGSKKCGFAISDAENKIAFPLYTLFYKNKKNDFKSILEKINEIEKEKGFISTIIIGFPQQINLNYDQEQHINEKDLKPNSKIILRLKKFLNMYLINKKIILINENYTTQQSLMILNNKKINYKKKNLLEDAIAAQQILNFYLDFINKKNI